VTLHPFSKGALLLLAAVACGSDGGTTPTTTATQIAILSGNNQIAAAGTALAPLQVLVRDAADAPVQGVTVNWSVPPGTGSVSAATSTSGVDGIASITRTLGPNAGTQTTTATRSGLAGSPITFSAIATVQGATQIALATVSGNNQTDTVLATLATPYAVLVRDHTNAPVAGVTVTWSALTGTITGTSVTDASGIATATRTLGATAGAQTAQATVTGLSGSPVGFTATANAGNPDTLIKTSGDAGTGGINTTVMYTVTVRDRHGNPKSGQQINWAVASGGGSITPTDNVTAANGQASGTRTLSGTAGPHTATAIASNSVPPDTVTFTTTATTAPATATITVGNNFFNPASDTIAVGGQVTWTWGAASNPHNVTFAAAAGAPADIATRTAAGSESRTFLSAGLFNYECTVHAGMSGSIRVQ
jgi:plastocyanin